jgi:hypothetical protein
LRIAFKTPALGCPLGQSLLAIVSKGRVTEVVGQTGGFDDIGIKPQTVGEFSADLSHLQ